MSKERDNYIKYTKGKAKLKSAVLPFEGDKIYYYIKKNTTRRRWILPLNVLNSYGENNEKK